MIIVVAALEFASQSDRDKAVALVADVQRLTREEEPGCYDYCFAPDPAVPTRMQVYELWKNEHSVVEHFKHENYKKMLSLFMESNIIRSENQIYRIDRHEPVYDVNGNPKDSFFR